MTTLSEIYWVAGMLEGEGSFVKQSKGRGIRIQFVTTDFDVNARVSRILGSNIGYRHTPTVTGKTVWTTSVCGKSAVGWMMTLYCIMGIRRQQKIKEMLEHWRLRK